MGEGGGDGGSGGDGYGGRGGDAGGCKSMEVEVGGDGVRGGCDGGKYVRIEGKGDHERWW